MQARGHGVLCGLRSPVRCRWGTAASALALALLSVGLLPMFWVVLGKMSCGSRWEEEEGEAMGILQVLK